ncbi:bacteriohemerythrin [Dechloromonas denitrificans]|uniref:bacteriohemerythrin n=1 Tax=Dechloromonas denitrificans TaxID=281362 RepID=UPI001CF7EDFC|nr:hemerythrin family protein [Dechloromonas denitrificans]UCV05209.1 hemerythrin family protein [Dechloromonas denitrificans]UCV09569.1 hemerythrin family protein [Dechloromonas denitrificans]
MPWDERYTLGVAEMDATHRDFVELADALLVAGDDEFPALFAELHEHTRRHFDNEGKLMKSCRFPAIGEHHSEHLRVLGELAHFSRGVAAGRLGMARNYVKGLPEWFATHLATMDSALSACLKRTN